MNQQRAAEGDRTGLRESGVLAGREVMPLLFRATGDGRSRPFPASAGNRPGIYAGLLAGEE